MNNLHEQAVMPPPRNIPLGYCQCGCGSKTTIATKNNTKNGYKIGVPVRFLPNHHRVKSPVKYCVDSSTGCWIWLLRQTRRGYGMLKNRCAHRVFYEAKYGPVPEGLELDHLCKNTLCVNPDHLEPVTRAENVRRSRRAKLTMDEANKIREMYSSGEFKHRDLAKLFGVSLGHISKITSLRMWK